MEALLMPLLVICISLVVWWISWRDERREKSTKNQ